MEQHQDWRHFEDSYRDAVAYLDAVRAGDGAGMHAVAENTPCSECFLQSVGEIGARLGDRAAAQAAAASALRELRAGPDGNSPE